MEVTHEHIALWMAGISLLVAIMASVITWLLTIKGVEKKLATKEEVDNKIKKCKEGQETTCGGHFQLINSELKKQSDLLQDHTKLLVRGDREFTALRLALGDIFDALEIPGGRKRWQQIRNDVLNGRESS